MPQKLRKLEYICRMGSLYHWKVLIFLLDTISKYCITQPSNIHVRFARFCFMGSVSGIFVYVFKGNTDELDRTFFLSVTVPHNQIMIFCKNINNNNNYCHYIRRLQEKNVNATEKWFVKKEMTWLTMQSFTWFLKTKGEREDSKGSQDWQSTGGQFGYRS